MNESINLLRDKLEKLIMNNYPYNEIYEASVNLDKLVVMYYENKFNLGQTG